MFVFASGHLLFDAPGGARQRTQADVTAYSSKAAQVYAQRVAAARVSAAKRMIGSVPMTNTERIRRWRQAQTADAQIARRKATTLARQRARLVRLEARDNARQAVHHLPQAKEDAHAKLPERAPPTVTRETAEVAAILLLLPVSCTNERMCKERGVEAYGSVCCRHSGVHVKEVRGD